MKAKIKITVSAHNNLKENSTWYNTTNKGLGLLFIKSVQNKINFISVNPLIYQIRYDNIRIAFTQNFPFGIHYEYLQTEDLIIIYAIFHTSQNQIK